MGRFPTPCSEEFTNGQKVEPVFKEILKVVEGRTGTDLAVSSQCYTQVPPKQIDFAFTRLGRFVIRLVTI